MDMSQTTSQANYLRSDLIALLVIISVFFVILIGLVYIDNSTDIITTFGKQIASYIIK
jgi:hypothetical protein